MLSQSYRLLYKSSVIILPYKRIGLIRKVNEIFIKPDPFFGIAFTILSHVHFHVDMLSQHKLLRGIKLHIEGIRGTGFSV